MEQGSCHLCWPSVFALYLPLKNSIFISHHFLCPLSLLSVSFSLQVCVPFLSEIYRTFLLFVSTKLVSILDNDTATIFQPAHISYMFQRFITIIVAWDDSRIFVTAPNFTKLIGVECCFSLFFSLLLYPIFPSPAIFLSSSLSYSSQPPI